MLGSMRDDEFGKLMTHPDENRRTRNAEHLLLVEDADAVYASAKAAGSTIVTEIKDEDYGGRGFQP